MRGFWCLGIGWGWRGLGADVGKWPELAMSGHTWFLAELLLSTQSSLLDSANLELNISKSCRSILYINMTIY